MKLRIGIDYGNGDSSSAIILREFETNEVTWSTVLSKPNDCVCESVVDFDHLRELFSDEPTHKEGCPAYDRWLVKKCIERLDGKRSSLWGPLDPRYSAGKKPFRFTKESLVLPKMEPKL